MHAGDPAVMRRTVKLAAEAGVAVGAHPGYPDLQGFGRRDIAMSPDEAYDYILYQIGALQAFCHAAGARMHHVKPHGQLYNRAAVDPELARAVAAAVHDANLDLVLVGLANSELIRAGQAEGIRTAQEFFADRNYTDEGLLVSRKLPDAVITDEDFAVARVVRAVKEGAIESASGKLITVKPDTICIHGDNVHARVRRQDPHRADRGRRRGEARVTTATSRNEAAGQWRTEQQPSCNAAPRDDNAQ